MFHPTASRHTMQLYSPADSSAASSSWVAVPTPGAWGILPPLWASAPPPAGVGGNAASLACTAGLSTGAVGAV